MSFFCALVKTFFPVFRMQINLKSNNLIKITIFMVLTLILLYNSQVLGVFAADGQHVSLNLTQEIGKGLGVFTAGLLVIGFLYVILTRGYIFIRKYVDKKTYPEIIQLSQELYAKYRKPLFYVHVTVNTSAIIFGTIHGLTVLIRNPIQADLGWLAIIIMIASSVSGFIMWHKIRPIWDVKDVRALIRASHRQWILTGLLIFVLFLHVALFRE